MRVWFQNRRAKFRKQERLAQQKASNQNQTGSSAESPNPPSIKAESAGTTAKSGQVMQKDVKPGSPHSSVSTTPNSNTSSLSSHHSSNGVDIKPVNNGRYLFAIPIITGAVIEKMSLEMKISQVMPRSAVPAGLTHAPCSRPRPAGIGSAWLLDGRRSASAGAQPPLPDV
ncbi:hypothetical protein GWI33_004926 [Rhynchophorus ferrugineus]|uniref:Homeobox domain-containing protein n=1 Tax=Rhynchophorus ferrugineus TaxID=354439 RepID=A0A834IU99_RHYFE|nr:hypothetical protein GWI33_004926 [Rhynchophorus ferrugineus]